MRSPKKTVFLAGVSLAAALLVAGCSGEDNEKTMATNADGSVSKTTTVSGGSSTPEAYNARAQAETKSNPYESTKGYPKKH